MIRTSSKLLLATAAIAGALVAALWWVLPVFPWWSYVVLWAMATGIWYEKVIKLEAADKIVDRS